MRSFVRARVEKNSHDISIGDKRNSTQVFVGVYRAHQKKGFPIIKGWIIPIPNTRSLDPGSFNEYLLSDVYVISMRIARIAKGLNPQAEPRVQKCQIIHIGPFGGFNDLSCSPQKIGENTPL